MNDGMKGRTDNRNLDPFQGAHCEAALTANSLLCCPEEAADCLRSRDALPGTLFLALLLLWELLVWALALPQRD